MKLYATTYDRLTFSKRRQSSSTPSSLVQNKKKHWRQHQHNRGDEVNPRPQPVLAQYFFKLLLIVAYIGSFMCAGNSTVVASATDTLWFICFSLDVFLFCLVFCTNTAHSDIFRRLLSASVSPRGASCSPAAASCACCEFFACAAAWCFDNFLVQRTSIYVLSICFSFHSA